MIKELHTKQVHLTPDGRLEVYDYKMANRLNTILRKYFEGVDQLYKFKKHEEAVFKVTEQAKQQVLAVLYKQNK